MSRDLRPAAALRLSIQALVVCLGALVAAGVAFAQGSWLGLVWLLMAGLTSNLAWYYHRRSRAAAPDAAAPESGEPGEGAASDPADEGAAGADSADRGSPTGPTAGRDG